MKNALREITEKKLIVLAAASLIVLVLAMILQPINYLVHGVIKTFIGGNAFGKSIVMLLSFIFLSLISLAFLRLKLYEKIKRFEKLFLAIFLIAVFAGFALGFQMFLSFSDSFGTNGPFATMVNEENYINWEATSIYHNHLPKAGLYLLKGVLPFAFSGREDDGRPFFEILGGAEMFGALFILIEIIVLVSGILLINSRIRETKFFDLLLFFYAMPSLMILMLDGGVTDAGFAVSFFFLALFLARNYLNLKSKTLEAFLPLMITFSVMFFLGQHAFEAVLEPIAFNAVAFFTALYLFANIKKVNAEFSKSRKIYLGIIFVVMLLLFFYSGDFLKNEITTNGFGAYVPKDWIRSFYVYGLNENAARGDVENALGEHLEVINFEKDGWTAWMQIKAKKDFRMREIDEKLKPLSRTYVYAEDVNPIEREYNYRIFFFDEKPNEVLRDNFLDLSVVSKEFDESGKSLNARVKGNTYDLLQMLSILTEIKNKYDGRVLISRT